MLYHFPTICKWYLTICSFAERGSIIINNYAFQIKDCDLATPLKIVYISKSISVYEKGMIRNIDNMYIIFRGVAKSKSFIWTTQFLIFNEVSNFLLILYFHALFTSQANICKRCTSILFYLYRLQYIIRITTKKSRIPICSGMANSFRFEPVPIPVPVPVPDWFRSGLKKRSGRFLVSWDLRHRGFWLKCALKVHICRNFHS